MKTILAVLVTALVTSSGAYAVEQAVTPGQFAALKRQVQTLQKHQDAITGYITTCLGKWHPMSQFNDYLAWNQQTQQPFQTTGLDLTQQGDQPSFYAPTASQNCTLQGSRILSQVFSGRALLKTAGPQARHP